MKIKTFILIACFSVVNVCYAGDVDDFFAAYIKGKSVKYDSNKKISKKDVQRLRVDIWNSWRKAVLKNEPFKLAELKKDSMNIVGRWKLPPNLENNAVLNYTLFNKDKKPLTGYPLFIYLHGSGPKEQEYKNGLVLTHRFNDDPSAYFVPQIPNEGGFYRWWQRAKVYAWEKLLRLVMISSDYNPDKIYFTGISEGAYGTQRLTSFFADYLAGGGAMAGGELLANAPAVNCANTAFSLLTGDHDTGFYRNTLTSHASKVFNDLEKKHVGYYKHRIGLLEGQGHAIDYFTTTPWLVKFSRNPYPKFVCWENFEMDGCRRKGFYNLYANQASHKSCNGRTFYEEKIENDTIFLNVDTVSYKIVDRDNIWGIALKTERELTKADHGNVTIYLNHELVDMNHNLTVVLNGEVKYHGKVKMNMSSMVNSCAAYGDPRRIYTAQIDLKW